tara:strand:+ start:923 stop:1477 length:555 start_codon:yes stop_codon:yes gene_type:complete
MPPTFNSGSIVIAITIIPMPPNHCKIALQIRILFGAVSILVIIVEPVVVIPDILSKKASTKDKFRLDSKNGKHPKMAIDNQDKVVNRKACCKFSFLFSSRLVRTKSIPIKVVMDAEERKILFFSSYIISIKNGISMNAPSITKRTPMAKKTVLLLFIFEVGGYLNIFVIQHNKNLIYLYFAYEI